jgi:large subunit ribosomal protein L10
MTVMRTGILSALARSMDSEGFGNPSIAPFLDKQTATLTCPDPVLNPIYLDKCLTAIRRAVKQVQKDGRKPEKQPRMDLEIGVLEGNRLVGRQEITRIAKLKDMEVLRGQVVGMLEGQGRSLVGILAQAGGGGLLRTLQGLEKDLGDKQGGVKGDGAKTTHA